MQQPLWGPCISQVSGWFCHLTNVNNSCHNWHNLAVSHTVKSDPLQFFQSKSFFSVLESSIISPLPRTHSCSMKCQPVARFIGLTSTERLKSNELPCAVLALGIQSPCQTMIGVIKSPPQQGTIFIFHYHSQKVIGSLGWGLKIWQHNIQKTDPRWMQTAKAGIFALDSWRR